MKIKNIEKVSQRLKKAIFDKEKIILYGDADLDGTSSVIILKETIEFLGGEIFSVYFPDREKEGYGLNDKAIDYLKKLISKDKALIIVVDCGITNFKEIDYAQGLGFEVIVIDHHQPLDKIPNASIVVDPKQPGDEYFFKNFANTGIIFRLAEEILNNYLSEDQRSSFLEITALATIADMMIQEEDNKFFINKGLETLLKTKRLGLIGLLQKKDFITKDLLLRDVAQKIISALNAADVIDHKTESYILLTSTNEKEINNLTEKLIKKSIDKQLKVKDLAQKIINKISKNDLIIFEGGKNIAIPLLGSAASKICQQTDKPVFLYNQGEINSRGAVRVPSGMNAVDIMKKSEHLFNEFGGHPPAAGFNIPNKNIELFKENLINYFKNL